jgi:hypothetical protein
MSNAKRRCPNCKKYNRLDGGLMIKNRLYCNLECATSYGKKNAPKAKAKHEKAARIDLRERKQELKTIPELTREAQSAVNAYIRSRDANKPCISCQVKTVHKFGGSMDAGHYRSRGSAAHLRFNVLNIHSQCVTCNRWQSGNVVDYRINLIKRIGLELVEMLESDNSTRKFDRDYLIRIKKIFNKRARWYKKRRSI